MDTSDENQLIALQKSFTYLCKEAKVFEKGNEINNINLDKLWINTKTKEKYAEIVEEYIRLLAQNSGKIEDIVIVTPDTISQNYGATPIVFLVAEKLGCKVAIWQEMGDFVNRRSWLIGDIKPRKKCIIVQDVVRSGITVLKIMRSFQKLEWQLIKYAALVLYCQDPKKLEATEKEYKAFTGVNLPLEYLITDNKLH
ncbi:MAG: phosphoribosyltransferase [Proteobacteria bacterium]|nr:phosphoribosyltransferase [Pseudomonadota bacterium]